MRYGFNERGRTDKRRIELTESRSRVLLYCLDPHRSYIEANSATLWTRLIGNWLSQIVSPLPMRVPLSDLREIYLASLQDLVGFVLLLIMSGKPSLDPLVARSCDYVIVLLDQHGHQRSVEHGVLSGGNIRLASLLLIISLAVYHQLLYKYQIFWGRQQVFHASCLF